MRVYPFAALRPAKEFAARVAAPPYDVLSTDEARDMVSGNPYSFLRVDKAEVNLPPDVSVYDRAVYEKAGEVLAKFAGDGVLIQDAKPCYYLYRLTMNGRAQTGLAACVDARDYNAGIIKKHEFTRPDKEQDRVEHMLACSAHTGPIFMAYRNRDSLREIIDGWLAGHPPEYDFTCGDGIRHELWTVDSDEAIGAIGEEFKAVPCVYIADGHHRSAAAARVAETATAAVSAEAGKFLAVIFPQEELEILDYNRLVNDLNGHTVQQFLERLRADFSAELSDEPVKPASAYEYGFYTQGQWYRLKYLRRPPDDEVEALAVSVLQNKILSPLLGIADPRSDKRIDFVGGARGTAGLTARVDSGEMAAAFTVSPTKMEELLSVADAGKIMPPKSTWFEPKLRSGLLIHRF